MRLGVGFIDELTRDKTVGNLFGEFVGFFDSPLHALGTIGQDEFCTVCFHDLASFNRHRFGHDDDNAITARSGNRCQTNSRIPRCRLDDDRSFAQNAARLGVVDHRLRNAVFHRSSRVKILDLRQNPRLQTVFPFDMRQLHQRRVTNQFICTLKNTRHDVFS